MPRGGGGIRSITNKYLDGFREFVSNSARFRTRLATIWSTFCIMKYLDY